MCSPDLFGVRWTGEKELEALPICWEESGDSGAKRFDSTDILMFGIGLLLLNLSMVFNGLLLLGFWIIYLSCRPSLNFWFSWVNLLIIYPSFRLNTTILHKCFETIKQLLIL